MNKEEILEKITSLMIVSLVMILSTAWFASVFYRIMVWDLSTQTMDYTMGMTLFKVLSIPLWAVTFWLLVSQYIDFYKNLKIYLESCEYSPEDSNKLIKNNT